MPVASRRRSTFKRAVEMHGTCSMKWQTEGNACCWQRLSLPQPPCSPACPLCAEGVAVPLFALPRSSSTVLWSCAEGVAAACVRRCLINAQPAQLGSFCGCHGIGRRAPAANRQQNFILLIPCGALLVQLRRRRRLVEVSTNTVLSAQLLINQGQAAGRTLSWIIRRRPPLSPLWLLQPAILRPLQPIQLRRRRRRRVRLHLLWTLTTRKGMDRKAELLINHAPAAAAAAAAKLSCYVHGSHRRPDEMYQSPGLLLHGGTLRVCLVLSQS
ncbi:uncharacterized protein LOC104583501 isoform X1 [Brachypodium distachyon]|uniref:uncharacterized protein LOC104583501 isoform X1 n=1 Tax=Brachypodium distachyon TaxID=15368 RepID=UPI000D0D4148|nr:uncharacterized protein LOC104583501 isoform X1 [Brachypodium distachyon]|eukprot:XP_014756953.2 uncharacterized protein LOC104583501 isoform X1 [Brachypodium distachyon]